MHPKMQCCWWKHMLTLPMACSQEKDFCCFSQIHLSSPRLSMSTFQWAWVCAFLCRTSVSLKVNVCIVCVTCYRSLYLKLKGRVSLSDIWLASCVHCITDRKLTSKNSFVIGWPTINYVISFRWSLKNYLKIA